MWAHFIAFVVTDDRHYAALVIRNIEDVRSTRERTCFFVARPLRGPRETDRPNKGALGILVLNILKVSSGLLSFDPLYMSVCSRM